MVSAKAVLALSMAAATAVAEGGAIPGPPPGSATLRDCFALARQRNESLGQADAGVALARADRRRARSGLLPEISLRDDFLKQESVDLGSSGVGGAFSFADRRNQVYLSLSQPLLASIATGPLLRAADATIEAAASDRAEAERLLLREVAGAFYGVLAAEREVETLEAATASERERLAEVEARREVGLARRTEVLLIRAQLSSDESRLLRAVNDRASAREELASLTGLPVGAALADTLELPARGGDPAPDAWSRTDVAAAEARVRAAQADLSAARRARVPRLDLDADLYIDRSQYSTFASETDWSTELTLTVPLWWGGRFGADAAAARARLSDAQLERDRLLRHAGLEVRQAMLALESDQAELATLEAAVEAAQEAHDLAREEYRAGLATSLEVLTAQQQLVDGRVALDRQAFQVKLSWMDLQLARGAPPAAILAEKAGP